MSTLRCSLFVVNAPIVQIGQRPAGPNKEIRVVFFTLYSVAASPEAYKRAKT